MILALLWACASTPDVALEPAPSPIPNPGPMPSWTPPAPLASQLDNGAGLWVLADNDLPLISLRIVFPGGSATDPEESPGAAFMAGLLMEEGAGERDSLEMTRAFGRLAASASINVETQAIVASLDVAADRFDEAYALLVDELIRPRLARTHLLILRHDLLQVHHLALEVGQGVLRGHLDPILLQLVHLLEYQFLSFLHLLYMIIIFFLQF